jgi:hypothetical protein
MNIPYSLFCAIVLLTATIIPAAAEPGSHSPQLIVLDQKVHVLTADGSDLLLDEGTYQLEAAEEWIRVIPDQDRTAAWLLEVHRTQHHKLVAVVVVNKLKQEEIMRNRLLTIVAITLSAANLHAATLGGRGSLIRV